MAGAFPPGLWRTPEERAEDDARREAFRYFEPDRTYYYEISKSWQSGYGVTDKIMSWDCWIKQSECPWMVVELKVFRYPTAAPFASWIARRKAIKYGKEYLKRGGPPSG